MAAGLGSVYLCRDGVTGFWIEKPPQQVLRGSSSSELKGGSVPAFVIHDHGVEDITTDNVILH